jgi:hypothetical protein
LKYSIVSDKHIFVHAGLDFGTTKDPMDIGHSILWIRDWYHRINYKWLCDRYIIHGHSPQSMKEIDQMYAKYDFDRILDIDAGCCYNDVKITINERGNVTNPTIVKSLGHGCDEEVIRVLSKMPKWKSAIHNNNFTKKSYILTVSFLLY